MEGSKPSQSGGTGPSEYISDQAEQLVDDAEAVGITEEELEETVGGDVVEYLREAYLKIEDPTSAFMILTD